MATTDPHAHDHTIITTITAIIITATITRTIRSR